MSLFKNIYKGKRVLITGHTGFKGSWLTFWLNQLEANIAGFSKDIPTSPNHYELLDLPIINTIGDVRNYSALKMAIESFQPDIIFHLAAQSLVRYSYEFPIETFQTNVIGSLNVFEAARHCDSVKAIVNITSDKCYENTERDIAYKESDRMGGYDPYSASKGCAELATNSFRNSFLNRDQYNKSHHILIASARAGNVIGGGDWAQDRLLPDAMKSNSLNRATTIRNPGATRPWQHVLEPLSGYLLLGQKLLEGEKKFADGWNFGPLNNESLSVKDVVSIMQANWADLKFEFPASQNGPHEATFLRLDCKKANDDLNWFPVWDIQQAVEKSVSWYKSFYVDSIICTSQNLNDYVTSAFKKQVSWTN